MNLLLLPLLGVLALAALGVVDRLIRRTELGLGLVALSVASVALPPSIELSASLGPFAVYADDVIYGLLGVAAVARLIRKRRLHPLHWLLVIFLVISVVAAVQGMSLHGPGSALNEARKNIYFSLAALYVGSDQSSEGREDAFARTWFGLGAFLLTLSIFRWGAFFSGVHSLLPEGDSLRVLASFETLVMLEALVLGMALLGTDTRPSDSRLSIGRPLHRRIEALSAGLFLAIVLMQHRTLWIALLMATAFLVARNPRITGRLVVIVVIGGLVASTALLVVFGQGVERIVAEDVSAAAQRVDTFEWRVEGWKELLERDRPDTAPEWLFGQPFGGGWDRYLGGQRITVSPHNYFLESFLRVGLVGLLVLLTIYAVTIMRLYPSSRRSLLLRHDALAIGLMVQVLYFSTSHPSAEQGAFLGAAVAAATIRTRPRVRPVPERPNELVAAHR